MDRGRLEFLLKFLQKSPQMASWKENVFIAIQFLQGFAVTSLVVDMIFDYEWRVLETKSSPKYMYGLVFVGIWEVCLPPTIEGPDNYSIHCCHKFSWFEKFFPVEMKIGQVSMPTALCLAVLGLIFVFLAYEWINHTPKQARWFFIAGGTFYVISSICILVPVSWNLYSVVQNKIIPFPSSFDLPPIVEQRSGHAVMKGYITGILLFICGTYIIGSGFFKPDRTFLPFPVSTVSR